MVKLSRKLRRDERGMSFVFVGMGFMAFLAATTLAIDVGMFMTARSQAQNAADAGALAGAVALAFNDYNDRSASGPAVQNALAAATANQVVGYNISITPPDVTFPNDPSGQPSRVHVHVFRTGGRGNPVSTLMGGLFGVPNADITAEATGEAAPANAATCIKPFSPPDKWIERQTPPWDPEDTFDAFPSNPSDPPDIYRPPSDPNYTGYNPERDRGLQINLKAGTGVNIAPSFYFPIALEGGRGAAFYRANIAACNTSRIRIDDLLTSEPGNMVGPTRQGIADLIALDPGAYWDTSTNRVVSSMNPSPRTVMIPMFDPYYWNVGKQGGRYADLKTANLVGFFIEGMVGGDVRGRITPITGLIDGSLGPAPGGVFARVIRLVQ